MKNLDWRRRASARLALGARLAAVIGCVLFWAGQARAWILPEHAEISVEATSELAASERQVLEALWAEARRGTPDHLCAGLGRAPADSKGTVRCIGFADLPAIAADHSCSPKELFREASEESWLRDVLEVGNITERRLREASNRSERINAWSHSNLLLQRADRLYATRATSNSCHFVPTAPPGQALDAYLSEAVKKDEPLNATGLYVVFHLSALRFAAAYADDSGPGRPRWAALALFTEAFAHHFLQDAFSSGHTVGIWGGAAVMKGTHDAYSIAGVPARTWSDDAYSQHGDAHIRPEDLSRARRAVASSLAEVTRAVTDATLRAALAARWRLDNASYLWKFDTCKSTELGFTVPASTALEFARSAWVQTPLPMPGKEHAHLPRFRAEIGPFFAFGAGSDAQAAWGGYFAEATAKPRVNFNAILYAGMGIGLEGAIGITSDGLIELGVGRNFASSQLELGCDECGADESGAFPSRVPTRSAILFHYRAPYWLIPGDLVVAAPILLLASFETYEAMAIVSANGGVFGIQQALLTSIGTFQFVLGREFNVFLFNQDAQVLAFNGGDPELSSNYSLYTVSSIKFDAPVLNYEPFRAYSNTLTSSLGLQLGGALELPSGTDNRTGEDVSAGAAYSVYLRLVMGSRWYLGAAAP